ncbi:MAG: hypothetical protein M3R36_15105 [Bacteroidota bacterium]|nr:hypothetical protein [Bacteroidota bacterium]
MQSIILLATTLILSFSSILLSQDLITRSLSEKKLMYNFSSNKIYADTIDKIEKSKIKKVSIGALFIAPTIGVSFPLGNFGNYSKSGFLYGAKLEIGLSKLYPFVIGFVYELQNNPGNPNFTNANFITELSTKITSIGGSLDIILNKYIKSNFTTTIFSLEVKYANLKREITPPPTIPIANLPLEESYLTYSAGLGFTIYILDLSAKYTFSSDYPNLIFQARFHLPIIRF